VKVLNYSPGPCDTDMQKQVRETTGHAPTSEFYTNFHKEVKKKEKRKKKKEKRKKKKEKKKKEKRKNEKRKKKKGKR
jgi:hypothetical protein